ncbi:MAG: hypothetical protein SCALA702_13750 [Melioribacteraceae bacterium]|nr:MAG: hypothetical protein SCALA702_13750 [Melioribacteraceae bacterium]
MPDENNVLLESLVINSDDNKTSGLINGFIEKLFAEGYPSLKIEISGDPRLKAATLNFDVVLFDRILETQKLPPAVVFDILCVKSSLGKKNFIERIDFEW